MRGLDITSSTRGVEEGGEGDGGEAGYGRERTTCSLEKFKITIIQLVEELTGRAAETSAFKILG